MPRRLAISLLGFKIGWHLGERPLSLLSRYRMPKNTEEMTRAIIIKIGALFVLFFSGMQMVAFSFASYSTEPFPLLILVFVWFFRIVLGAIMLFSFMLLITINKAALQAVFFFSGVMVVVSISGLIFDLIKSGRTENTNVGMFLFIYVLITISSRLLSNYYKY